MAGGECDQAVGYFPVLPDGLRSMTLFRESVACLVAADHPTISEPMSLAQLAAAHHVVFGSPFSPLSTLEAMLDEALGRLGIQRKLGMRVASVLLSPFVVAQPSMLAVLPQVFARHFASFLPLRMLATPFEAPAIDISMLWHERSHRLSVHQWVRGVVRQIVEEHVAGK